MDKREESEGIAAEMEENTLPGATCKSLLTCIVCFGKKNPAPSMLRHACAPKNDFKCLCVNFRAAHGTFGCRNVTVEQHKVRSAMNYYGLIH